MHLKKLALIIEYDGSGFHGFQAQAQSPTVQEELERAIERFTGERLRVICASRTDAGVHAKGQVVSFRTRSSHAPETFVGALNHFLPQTVGVLAAYEIPMGFDIRKAAVCREYRYVILNRPAPSPLLRRRAHWVAAPIAVEAMNQAAALLVGERDFAPFSGSLVPPHANTRKRLTRAEFRRCGDLVIFRVAGSAFLHQQVRRMAGALLKVGLGKCTLEEFEALASRSGRSVAGPALPPHGLYLESVQYEHFPPAKDGP